MSNPFSNILFLDRLRAIIDSQKATGEFRPLQVHLHLTDLSTSKEKLESQGTLKALSDGMTVYDRRIRAEDLRQIVSGEQHEGGNSNDGTVCYVCGPPVMTDEFVKVLQDSVGESTKGGKRVFYEKWW